MDLKNKVIYTVIKKSDIKEATANDTKLARLVLKKLLDCVNLPYDEILITDDGKPYFKNNLVCFNYSHSKMHVACAISLEEVGIDIEDMGRIISDRVSKKYLNNATSNEKRCEAWVRKESYAKMVGKGIAMGLNNLKGKENASYYLKTSDYYLSVSSSNKKAKFIFISLDDDLVNRCSWCNLQNKLYTYYHDHEWGKLETSDKYLLEMLILESFQAGLSWECILNKRESFKKAYDDFDLEKIINYNEDKINELCNDSGIVRNKRKIIASINNAKIFKNIINEYGSFYNYLKTFTGENVIYETGLISSPLSDKISNDLKGRGMSFVGTVIIYSFLQAIGIINSHEEKCFLYRK